MGDEPWPQRDLVERIFGPSEARAESAPHTQNDVEQFFLDHPEAHVCARGVNPFTGAFSEIFERQEITIDDLYQGPPYFKNGFLDWLKVEMKYNPEWKERYADTR